MDDELGFDKHIVAQTSLEILIYCLKSVDVKKTYWQWIYISLHSTVQAYMVLALTGSNSLLTYRKKDAKKWLEKYDNNRPLPNCYLDEFMNLYKKTKSEEFRLYENSQRFTPTPTQDWAINQLNHFRNDFIHFKFGGFMIVMSDHPYQIVIDSIDYIDFLAFQSNNIFWGEETNEKETQRLLNECKSIIKTLVNS